MKGDAVPRFEADPEELDRIARLLHEEREERHRDWLDALDRLADRESLPATHPWLCELAWRAAIDPALAERDENH
jgi:hypothetical protein